MPEMTDQKFANAALDAGLVTTDMVKECAAIQKRQREMGLLPKSVKDLLVEKGYIDDRAARHLARGEQPEEAAKKEKIVRIGGYEVISRLGKGQMGSVYKARQVSLDRILALKVLPSRLAGDKRYLQRFLREAKSAGRLNHPNIVTAVEFGESNGLYYYAMDYVEGVNLRDIIEEEGKLSEDEALAITLQVARALEHAHENGIIHRDIKPENIMVDSEGRARLCDLGLAREANEDGALTQAGIVLGTPYYVSPEQAEGRRDLDTRSDIYSLGVTFFHIVTGRVPFQGNTGPAIMVKHITEKMPSPREFNPDLSNGTVQIIKKMTAKKREQRYNDPVELIADIERVIKGERPAAAGPVIKARKRRSPGAFREEIVVSTGGSKKYIPLLVVAALVLVVVIIIASMANQKREPRKRPGGRTSGASDTVAGTSGDSRSSAGDSSGEERRTPAQPGSLPLEQREIMQIMQWARTNQDKTEEIARKYREFIETASNPEAVKTARQALEGVAARENISLQRKFESLMATGKAAEALEEVENYLKMFKSTKQSEKALAMRKKATAERDKKYEQAIANALKMAGENRFKDALGMLSDAADGAPKNFKQKLANAKKEVEKSQKAYVAAGRTRAESTRPDFEKTLAGHIEALRLSDAASLIDERIKVEVDTDRGQLLSAKAEDLRQADMGLALIMANLKNIEGLKQTFNIDRRGDEQGIVEKVKDVSFIFAAGPVTREVKLNQLNPDDIVRLAELGLGPEPARTRNRLGLLFLMVLDAPPEARKQFAEAEKLGMDISRFAEKIAVSHVREALDKAATEEGRKKYLEAALEYSKALAAMSELESFAGKIDEVKMKIDSCLRESGAQNAFAGKVTIEKGTLVVTYDFADATQWRDFEGYIWNEKIKRDKVTEWMVDKGVMIGKGSEGILWKGKFSGDVALEVDVTPVEPAEPRFFLKLCDDGRGSRGKNYTFGFSYWIINKIPVGRRGNQVVYRDVKKDLGHYIARLRGSSNKYDYLKQGMNNPVVRAGTTYKIKVEKEDDILRVFINGNKIYETEDKDYKKGGISLKVTNSIVHFDNMKITGEFDQSWLKSELRKAR